MSGYPIAAGNGWSYQTYDFSAYSNIYVRFLHVANNQIWYLDDVQVTLAAPTVQVSALDYSSISGKQFTLNWTNGNGNGRAIFVREANAGTPTDPIDGTNYTASANWNNKGTQLGTSGYYCVYNGNGSSVTLNQLNPDTGYYIVAFEYNNFNSSYTYMTRGATGSVSTKTSSESDYFRTIMSGNWNDTATWESSPNNTTWYSASLIPSNPTASISIGNNHVITLSDNVACSTLNGNGGTIQFGNYNLNVTNAVAGTPRFVINGSGVPSKFGTNAHVMVSTTNPASLPDTLSALTIDCGTGNLMILPNDVLTTDITFSRGGISLGNNDITATGTVSGTPNLLFNGTGVANGIGNASNSDISVPNPTAIPPVVYELEVNLGEGNTANLPNDVEVTNFTLTSGSLNLNNHKLSFPTKGMAISSADAVISALNFNVSNTINYFGGQSIARTWTTSGTFTNAVTLYFTYPETETIANTVKVWTRNHGETGAWNVLGSFPAVANGSLRTVTITGITNLNGSSKGDLDWTVADTDQTLPVELSSFTCVATPQNYVMLDWVTQTETNVAGFYVYRNQADDLLNATRINAFVGATNTSQIARYTFIDNEATPGFTWYYWLQHVDLDGEFEFHGPVSLTLNSNNIVIPNIPLENNISVYPNPFNPQATISFGITKDADIDLVIYNLKGERVKQLIQGSKSAGTHRIIWNGRDDNGKAVSSGMYLVRLSNGAFKISKKIVLQK
jgi:hypothetical protein